MKNLRSIVSLMLMTHGASGALPAQRPRPGIGIPAVDAHDALLTRRDGRLLYDGTPWTGTLMEWGTGGERLGLTAYHHGRRDGMALTWHADGSLDTVRQYLNGVKVGWHRGYWPNGQRRFAVPFSAGRYDGVLRTWHANGQLHQHRTYIAGAEDGVQRLWAADGRLRANYVVRDGRRYGRLGAQPCLTVKGGVA